MSVNQDIKESFSSTGASGTQYHILAGLYTLLVLGDLDGAQIDLYFTPNLSETTAGNYGVYADDAGTAITLSGAASATAIRSMRVYLPQGRAYLGISGGTSPDVQAQLCLVRQATL